VRRAAWLILLLCLLLAPACHDDRDANDDGDDDTAPGDDDVTLPGDELTRPNRTYYIRNGQAVSVRVDGDRWQQTPDYVKGAGASAFLHATNASTAERLRVSATLRIDPLLVGRPAFVFGGLWRFVFRTTDDRMRLEGPDIPDDGVDLGPRLAPLRQPFSFGVERDGDLLAFWIGTDFVVETPIAGPVGSLGFTPGGGQIGIEEFWTEGPTTPLREDPPQIAVFESWLEGYAAFRIPALAVTPSGAVLAFSEARRWSVADSGNIDLVLRRSFDGGATWQPLQVVVDLGFDKAGDPAPIVRRDSGEVVLLFTSHALGVTEHDIHLGEGSREIWVTRSADDGATWSEPVNISAEAKAPDWRWYATGPGHGIELTSGRLMVACDHSTGPDHDQWFSHVVFSDDGGTTWQRGGTVPDGFTNECTLAERADGSLLLNMRNYRGTFRRAISVSVDDGMTWSAPTDDPALLEPVCQASLLAFAHPTEPGEQLLAFSNPAAARREAMAVRLSDDGGATWPARQWIHLGAAAYSDLALLPSGDLALLFERGKTTAYESIVFTRFSPTWLAGGDSQP
jgi:sialidase-1